MNNQQKILIVDDDTINLDFFDVMLSKLGFKVENAKDGVQAIEKVKRFNADLILLDNVMPRMSGWEVTKILKSDPKYKDIPIIMFSALDDIKDKIEGFDLGIEDYITKPFNFTEVLARIRTVLKNRELYSQIIARESRLALAEKLNAEIKAGLQDLVKGIDGLDEVVANPGNGEKSTQAGCKKHISAVSEKSQAVRKQAAELDAKMEKTLAEWDKLKKKEIDLSQLDTKVRKVSAGE